MLTLEQCKKILNKDKENYTDEEIEAIRDWLSMMADIILESVEMNAVLKRRKRCKKEQ